MRSFLAVVIQPAPGAPKATGPPALPAITTLASLTAGSSVVPAAQPDVGGQAKELQQAGIRYLVPGKAP